MRLNSHRTIFAKGKKEDSFFNESLVAGVGFVINFSQALICFGLFAILRSHTQNHAIFRRRRGGMDPAPLFIRINYF